MSSHFVKVCASSIKVQEQLEKLNTKILACPCCIPNAEEKKGFVTHRSLGKPVQRRKQPYFAAVSRNALQNDL